ncbi:hypothetical protein AB0B18_24225 [Micromonospora chalcea]
MTEGAEMDRRFDDVDVTLRAAAERFEEQLDEILDVEAGLRDILMEDDYRQLDEELSEVLDVEAGLAAVLGEGDCAEMEWPPPSARRPRPPGAGQQGGDCMRYDLIKVTFTPDCKVPEQPDTLERVRRLAAMMFGTLMDVQLGEPGYEAGFAIKRAVNQAERCARAFRALPDLLEARVLGRTEAVDIVRRTADAFMALHTSLAELRAAKRQPVQTVKNEVFNRAVEASRLQGPVARLFDPSDDVVEALL